MSAGPIRWIVRHLSTVARLWILAMALLLAAAGAAFAAPGSRARPAGGVPSVIGVGNVPGCITGSTGGLSVLRSYHASVLRVVIDPQNGADGQALGCVRAAVGAGDKVQVAIVYSNRWSTRRVVAYFGHVLASYAPYAWAISIGNEQELLHGGATATSARYAAVWRAVEPVVTRLAPRAIRVAGEISPWGLSFLQVAYRSGLPGVQAISVHSYTSRLGFNLPRVMAWVRTTHRPLWVTEGLDGPGAWPPRGFSVRPVPLSQMAGVALAGAWLR